MTTRIECDGCMCPACEDCFQQPETLNEFNRQQRETRLRLETSRHPPLAVPTSHLERSQRGKASGSPPVTTSQSPLRVLKAQADNIAKMIKAVERGENPVEDRGGKLAAARHRDSVKFCVVMDDKLLSIEMPWVTIRETSETGIAEYILKYMRDARDPVQ